MEKKNEMAYPAPYTILNGCLYVRKTNKSGEYTKKLCNFTPYIVREVCVDDGAGISTMLTLGGNRENGSVLPEIEIKGSELSGFNWLIEKWGAGCVIEVGATVKDSIRHAIQMTAKDASRETEYAVTGWKEIDRQYCFLLPGDPRFTIRLEDRLRRYETVADFTIEDIRKLQILFTDFLPAQKEICWPLLAFTFLSPLNEFLHQGDCEPKFVTLLLGRTGTRKSTLAALFLSFFGRFTASDLPLSFRDTANSIVYNLFTLKDVLTCIDDFHPCGRKQEQDLTKTAQDILRSYGDRVGRGKLTADSRPISSRRPQGNAIITAEFSPEVGESGFARSFALELKDGDVDLSNLSLLQRHAQEGLLRRCMYAYTQWLAAKYLKDDKARKQFVSLLSDRFVNYRDQFNKSGIPCHGRLPEIVAWFRIGMEFYCRFLQDMQVITAEESAAMQEEFRSLLYAYAGKQAAKIREKKPTVVFICKLLALLESGRAVVVNRMDSPTFLPSNLIGYEDDEWYCLHADVAQREVKKLCEEQGELFTCTKQSLLRALAEEGLIETADGQNTKPVRVGTSTKRLMCLDKKKAKAIYDSCA